MRPMIDSGAWTAWNSGKPIELQSYIDFLKANADWIGTYVNLDVISPDDPEAGAAQGMANYREMRRQGLDPIPVFHAGEDVRWLKEMLDLGASYIGLAALSMKKKGQMDRWYDLVWAHLVSPSGLPLVRVHGFGEAKLWTLLRHPWQSSDSTSWVWKAMKNGLIPISDRKMLSHRKDGASRRALQDIGSLEELDQDVWREMLVEAGIDYEGFDDRGPGGYILRSYMAARYYMKMGDKITAAAPVRYRPATGFIASALGAGKPIVVDHFDKYLVVGNHVVAQTVTAILKSRNVLVSYAHIREPEKQINIAAYARDPMGFVLSSPPHLEQYNLIKDRVPS